MSRNEPQSVPGNNRTKGPKPDLHRHPSRREEDANGGTLCSLSYRGHARGMETAGQVPRVGPETGSPLRTQVPSADGEGLEPPDRKGHSLSRRTPSTTRPTIPNGVPGPFHTPVGHGEVRTMPTPPWKAGTPSHLQEPERQTAIRCPTHIPTSASILRRNVASTLHERCTDGPHA